MLSSRVMILVGLTGGIATGKSTVANMFERCGAVVIDADALAHQVVEPGKPAWRAIIETFGKAVLNPDRTLNRQALGAVVFRSRTKLRRLEQIIHPRVAREQARLTRQAARKDPKAVVIYDVPLLYEAGIDKRVDRVIVVTADRETQIARLKKRNGFTRTEALRRIRSQMPLKEKAAAADYLLDGTTTRPRLLALVKRLYRELRTLA
jgi:dephospho-CoA kinase